MIGLDMPVRFEIEDGTLFVRQSFDFPTVYLDHWAIRHFSSMEAEGQRFVQALKSSGGTLVVSHANLAEITGPEDDRHATEISDFLEAVLPNIYFAMFDVGEAMTQEAQSRAAGVRLMPPPDIELLEEVARQRSDDFRPFTVTNIIKVIAENRDRLGAEWRKTNQAIADRVNEFRRDTEFVRRAKGFTNHPVHEPTLAVFQELLRPVYLDENLSFDLNDGGDIQHAILSIAYCDFVLLDGKWEDLNDRMKRRFTQLGLAIPTAQVFSARRRGANRFLEALEVVSSTNFRE